MLCILFCFGILFSSHAQDVGEVVGESVTVKEWEFKLFLNTSGGGIGFSRGRTPNHFNKHFWEIDFLYNMHPKSVRVQHSDMGSYCYGKMVDLFFLRGGYGYQRVLHHKPYWGGVQVRYTLSGGFALGMGLPVVLKILVPDNFGGYSIEDQQYDPDNEYHTINYILKRAGFFNGIAHTKIRPGFYVKTGFHFDFSQNSRTIHAVETGMSLDMVFPYIQQMAFNKAKPFYLCAYAGYHFGKKQGLYRKVDLQNRLSSRQF
ncbi:MAG: hypothetical protein LBR51_03880 [Bacteroidales bacterium]|nr:hypothetical protein [Bacteroidales bacterium]